MGVIGTSDSTLAGADGGIFANESAGEVTKVGPHTCALDVIVNDAGRIVVFEGVLRFAHTFTQTGGAVIVRGGRAEFDNPVTLQGGRIGGNGPALIQRLTNVGGSVNPGESPGAFTLEGDYEQSSGGTLDVRLIDGFVPQAGDRFVILTAGLVSGPFSDVIVSGAPPQLDLSVTYDSGSVVLEFVQQQPDPSGPPTPRPPVAKQPLPAL